MSLIDRSIQQVGAYLNYFRLFQPNVRLLLLATVLGGLGWGIFAVDFNLYILALGFDPADLGVVLSMAPLAQMLAAIPVGLIAELAGFRRVYLVILTLTGLMQILQASAASLALISIATFMFGLGATGTFVIKLPFLNANSGSEERTHVFSTEALLQGAAVAAGALIAGYLPGWLGFLTGSPVLQYRYTLYLAGMLSLASLLPVFAIRDQPQTHQRKISLKPYLWGMDRFTFHGAFIEFFIGLTMGLIVPFMNIYFIFNLGASREYFSGVEALVWVPTTIALALGPILALRLGVAESIAFGRLLIPFFPLLLGYTKTPLLAALAYWGYRASFSMSQSNWFSLAMSNSKPKARVAISAWLEITFQIGMAIAALTAGRLLSQGNDWLLFALSAGSAGVSAVLTLLLITRPLRRVRSKELAG